MATKNDLAAKNFLDLYQKVQQSKESCYARPSTCQKPSEIAEALNDAPETVILSKIGANGKSLYYAGIKPGGEPRWVAFEKYALSVSRHLVHLYEEKLGESLFPLWPYA